MRIAYLTPGLGPCGGVRVIAEHVSRLAARGHLVALGASRQMIQRFSKSRNDLGWIKLHRDVVLAPFEAVLAAPAFDVVVATGYGTVHLASQVPGKAHYYFVQMMEYHFFERGSHNWKLARESYPLARDLGFGVITIAEWLKRTMWNEFGLGSIIVPNGVNKQHFFPDGEKEHAILVEGDDRNPAKDIEHLSWRVADQLREEYGVELWGYSAVQHRRVDMLDRFYKRPTTRQMRSLYSRALFLLKASRYEGRACAPVEAMCCGTPSVRGIVQGDDDLLDMKNCVRCEYDYSGLLDAGRLMFDEPGVLEALTDGARGYAAEHLNWSDKIALLEDIYEALE
jgi:hypothetical protein